jgi:putative CocE/NonD family hydrolase
VLVYTSEALTDPVEIVGRVFVKLVAASDAVDTDFTAKLLDVHPDGRAVLLGPSEVGVRRARYRNGYEKTEPLTPGKAEEYTIELFDIGHRFLAGHRIRLEISSSASPYIAPNTNTGLPVATDTTWRIARQSVFHDRRRPSRVLLPVLPIPDPPAGGVPR